MRKTILLFNEEIKAKRLIAALNYQIDLVVMCFSLSSQILFVLFFPLVLQTSCTHWCLIIP